MTLAAIPWALGYLVSDDGRVFSTWTRVATSAGKGTLVARLEPGAPSELARFDRKNVKGEPTGYLSVSVGGRKGKVCYVQRLVLEAFVGPAPSPAHEACHKSGDRADNRLENLYWGTKAENTADRVRDDAFARGWETRRAHAFADLLEAS